MPSVPSGSAVSSGMPSGPAGGGGASSVPPVNEIAAIPVRPWNSRPTWVSFRIGALPSIRVSATTRVMVEFQRHHLADTHAGKIDAAAPAHAGGGTFENDAERHLLLDPAYFW